MTKEQERTRGAAFFLSAMSGVQLTDKEAKTMATTPFAEWPEELKEKTMPYCGMVEIADQKAASAEKTQSGK